MGPFDGLIYGNSTSVTYELVVSVESPSGMAKARFRGWTWRPITSGLAIVGMAVNVADGCATTDVDVADGPRMGVSVAAGGGGAKEVAVDTKFEIGSEDTSHPSMTSPAASTSNTVRFMCIGISSVTCLLLPGVTV
jgi:hypothetical protein